MMTGMASDGGETAPSSPPRDVVADRYRITGRLGRGGMGTVWQATDELLRRQVAIKELHLSDQGLTARQRMLRRERALREARTAALIRHPHVVVVHDVVEDEGHPWIVMELIDGRSLAEILEHDGPLPPREAARMGAAVAGALRAAHEQGIQHRDVKPANVLIEYDTGRAVLTDFGIARVPGTSTISETGAFVGSPEYTAPERMSGHGAGLASDLWSLGALLCAAVHGESPFHRDSIGAIVHAVAIGAFTPPEEAQPLLPVVIGLLDRDPVRRMGSAEAGRLLGAFAETGELPEPRAAEPGPLRRKPEREAVRPPEETEAADRIEAPIPERPDVPVPPGPAEPSPYPSRGRRLGGGVRMIVVGALVVLAVSAGATAAAFLVSRRNADAGPGAAPATASPPPSRPGFPPPGFFPPPGANGPPSPPPDGQGPPPGAPGTPPLPPGYHLVTDAAGFSVILPPGYVRAAAPPDTYYWSADHTFRFGAREQRPDPRGPYKALNERHLAGPKTYAGYRDGVVTSTREHGQPAALWEFTYESGGTRRAFELCWTENGRMSVISLAAPVAQVEKARGVFDVARGTFHAS
jgi:serine/threonine protein kinase